MCVPPKYMHAQYTHIKILRYSITVHKDCIATEKKDSQIKTCFLFIAGKYKVDRLEQSRESGLQVFRLLVGRNWQSVSTAQRNLPESHEDIRSNTEVATRAY